MYNLGEIQILSIVLSVSYSYTLFVWLICEFIEQEMNDTRGENVTSFSFPREEAASIFYLFSEFFKYPKCNEQTETNYSDLLTELTRRLHKLYGNSISVTVNISSLNTKQLQAAYMESYAKIAPPIESVYKEWTVDPTCTLPFAKSKGFLLGDSALHIRFLLKEFEITIPEEYFHTPDHLVILLELLAIVIENSEQSFIRQYVDDHFDWLDELITRLEVLPDHHIYLQITRLLHQSIHKLKTLTKITVA